MLTAVPDAAGVTRPLRLAELPSLIEPDASASDSEGGGVGLISLLLAVPLTSGKSGLVFQSAGSPQLPTPFGGVISAWRMLAIAPLTLLVVGSKLHCRPMVFWLPNTSMLVASETLNDGLAPM